MASFDFKGRFYIVLKCLLIVGLFLFAFWGLLLVRDVIMVRVHSVACTANLRKIGQAMIVYREHNNNHLPPYLTMLYPDYLEDRHALICPADRTRGASGAFPRWSRYTADGFAKEDWIEEYAYADLDGPTLDPKHDTDSAPSSYYYRFNAYPMYKPFQHVTWQQYMQLEILPEFGNRTPVVSCLWHLPQHPEPKDTPMLNLLHNMTTIEEHPREWWIHLQK